MSGKQPLAWYGWRAGFQEGMKRQHETKGGASSNNADTDYEQVVCRALGAVVPRNTEMLSNLCNTTQIVGDGARI